MTVDALVLFGQCWLSAISCWARLSCWSHSRWLADTRIRMKGSVRALRLWRPACQDLRFLGQPLVRCSDWSAVFSLFISGSSCLSSLTGYAKCSLLMERAVVREKVHVSLKRFWGQPHSQELLHFGWPMWYIKSSSHRPSAVSHCAVSPNL